jgi:radical SAM superfamily enzyme YgiQ (UPF0313 family)
MLKRPAVLVNPPVTLEERYGKLSTAGSSLPPFALMWLASYARENGFESSIMDSEALGLTVSETATQVLAQNPWIVGFTASTLSIAKAAAVARKIQEARPEIHTVSGGPHFAAAAKKTMEAYPEFDIGVNGEGEETWRELLECLQSGGNPSKVLGTLTRIDGGIWQAPPRPVIEPLDKLPMPAWDLLPELTRHYQPSALRQHRSPASSLVTTRGCFGACTFCDNSVFGQRVRGFSADYVFRMVKHLVDRYGVKYITFYDDNFAHHKHRLRQLLGRWKQELDVTWSANSRVDVVNEECLELMASAGCWQISWGIETGDQKILDYEAKHVTIDQIRKALGWSNQSGIYNKGFFIIGHPFETVDSIQRTIDLALELPLDDFQMSFMTPFPGTEIYRNWPNYGVLKEDWERMNMWTPVFVPHGMTAEQLIGWQKTAIRRFYFRPRILKRYLGELTSVSRWKAFVRGALAVTRALITPGEGIGSPKPEEGLLGMSPDTRKPARAETICR